MDPCKGPNLVRPVMDELCLVGFVVVATGSEPALREGLLLTASTQRPAIPYGRAHCTSYECNLNALLYLEQCYGFGSGKWLLRH